MSNPNRKIQPKSVAAFLFMPQFNLSFQHFSFIVPVFMRTVAVMFEQAGLLPPNHPATMYGVEGVRKFGLFELLGEAWFTLRRTKATPYQWGLFSSVVLMIVFVILSVLTTIMHLSEFFVSSAQAQIYDLPNNAQSNMATVPADQGSMFSRTIPPAGGHGDYGIMILDKMLRQGAQGIGGPIQNAFGSLMQIYNAGILVIAGVMLGWLVLSIVVDTAKTGQVGGGRHNMVWGPMRIVFALGLLIPLGSSGFSSGQYMVMKLAEWGSNFGTRAWVQYVTGVSNGSHLLAAYGQQNPTGIVAQYEKMWICRVAYNGIQNTVMGTGKVPTAQIIQQTPAVGMPDNGKQMFTFTNGTGGNLCGSVTYPTQNDPALQLALKPPQGSTPDAVSQAIANYKIAVLTAYQKLMTDGGSGAGSLGSKANDFACGFVAQHVMNNTGDALAIDCGGDGGGRCNSGPAGSGKYPDTSCITDMVTQFNNDVKSASSGALTTLTNLTTQPAFLNDVQARGWAGMGIWYHRIEQMNSAVAEMAVPEIAITGGDPTKDDGLLANKMNEILGKYQDWWLDVPARSDVTKPTTSPYSSADSTGLEAPTSKTALKDIFSSADTASPIGFANAVTSLATQDKGGTFILDVIDPANKDTYPLAQLAAVGSKMFYFAVSLYATITVAEVLGAGFASNKIAEWTVGWVFNPSAAAAAFVGSPFPGLLATVAGVLFMASLVLKFYIPLMPFLRAAHAVLTWMISVFEAVVMVPVAALAHLTTEGEGLAGGAKGAWILWLNILLRPVLTVIGFVAALLIFNTFVVYFHDSFAMGMLGGFSEDGGIGGLGSTMAYTIIYVFVIYTAANSTFKLMDLIPSAMMKWIGGGTQDTSFDHDHAGALTGAGQLVQSLGSNFGRQRQGKAKGPSEDDPSIKSPQPPRR